MPSPQGFLIFTLHMKLTLIGAGKLGTQLYNEFIKCPTIELVQWLDRSANKELTSEGIEIITSTNSLKKADLYLLAINDESIPTVSKLLSADAFVVHTSGGTSLTPLSAQKRRGVFYPVQTFSSDRVVDFLNLPIGIEASNPEDLKFLNQFASLLKARALPLDSTQRKTLHLAAVLVNNFTNHLFTHAAQICEANQLSFDILRPLLSETVDKLNSLSPEKAQTGPAIRRDHKTITEHLEIIDNSELKKLYQDFTLSIQKHYGNEKL